MKILKALFLSILVGANSFAQEKSPLEASWVRFESPDRNFSFSLPPTGYLVDNEDGKFGLHYVTSQITVMVSITQESDAINDFKIMYKFDQEKEKSKYFQIGDFLVKQNSKENAKKKIDFLSLRMASSKGAYNVSVRAKDPLNDEFLRFVGSIRLQNNILLPQKKSFPPDSQAIQVSSLKSDLVILDALKKPDSQQSKLEKGKEPENDGDTENYSRGVIVLRKLRASYTEAARRSSVGGTVKFAVVFSANGELGDITLISSLDRGLDKNAFEAVKKIKFLPAEKDGKPVNVTKVVEYNFSIY